MEVAVVFVVAAVTGLLGVGIGMLIATRLARLTEPAEDEESE